MYPYHETKATWDKLAGLYADNFMDLDLYDESYLFFCKLLREPNASILEIGCGPGNITRFLKKFNPDFRIDATDVSPEMIAIAKENCPDVSFSVMDARDILQLDKKYDGIVSGFCIPYLSPFDFSAMLHHCNSLLNENGILYLSFVEGDAAKSGYLTASSGDQTYFNYYPLDAVLEELVTADFKVLKVMHINFDVMPGREEIHTVVISESVG